MRRIERALFLVLTLFIMLLLVACGAEEGTEVTAD